MHLHKENVLHGHFLFRKINQVAGSIMGRFLSCSDIVVSCKISIFILRFAMNDVDDLLCLAVLY